LIFDFILFSFTISLFPKLIVNQEICLSEIESSSNGCYQKEITLLLESNELFFEKKKNWKP